MDSKFPKESDLASSKQIKTATRISFAWVGLIVVGVGGVLLMRGYLDKLRLESMQKDGPKYSVRHRRQIQQGKEEKGGNA
eukprot:m.289670 g.289670  ORF g.289670 m.289670 type:complete len:80 (-) comp16376_c3_seq8:47-286(-)